MAADIAKLKKIFANDAENTALHTAFFWAAFIVQFLANSSGHGRSETLALTALIILNCCFRLLNRLCNDDWHLMLLLGNMCAEAALIVMIISAFKVDMGDFL